MVQHHGFLSQYQRVFAGEAIPSTHLLSQSLSWILHAKQQSLAPQYRGPRTVACRCQRLTPTLTVKKFLEASKFSSSPFFFIQGKKSVLKLPFMLIQYRAKVPPWYTMLDCGVLGKLKAFHTWALKFYYTHGCHVKSKEQSAVSLTPKRKKRCRLRISGSLCKTLDLINFS